MSNFILPRVTESESKCRCGCEVVASLYFLRTISRLLTLYNKPVKITTSYRCPEYNNQIGGVKDSPHLLNDAVFGANAQRLHEGGNGFIPSIDALQQAGQVKITLRQVRADFQ